MPTIKTQQPPVQQPDWMYDASLGGKVQRGASGSGPGAPVAPGDMQAFGGGALDNWNAENGIPPPQQPQTGPSAGNVTDDWTQWNEWSSLWDSIRGGKTDTNDLANIGERFSKSGGGIEGFRQFLEHPAWKHALAFSLKGTPAWKQLSELQFPTEQLLSSGMGQIGAAGRQAVDQGMASLQQSGLGRSPGAAASIQRGARVAAGQAGAQLGATVKEKAYGAEMGKLGTMLQLEQAMQQIALGISPDRSNQGQSNKPSSGDYLALLGSLAGAGAAIAACWVAREVYGIDNPKWVLFRTWMMNQSPRWFRKLYLRHGEAFARFLRRVPWLKRPIRAWMDRRIENLCVPTS